MSKKNNPVNNTDFQRSGSLHSAIDWINHITESLAGWFQSVRDETGMPGRFRWSRTTTRPANIVSTKLVLNGLRNFGLTDRIITGQDRKEGVAWVESLRNRNGQYFDPVLMNRRPDKWPKDKEYPDSKTQQVISQYATSLLDLLTGEKHSWPVPPEGVPQPDEADKALAYVKSLPWDTGPWGAGSHAMRMTRYLIQWHEEGKIPIEPAIETLNWLYSIQDPQTGLWGKTGLPAYERINSAFKLMLLFCDQLCLPLPYADKIIDQVLAEFKRPDYNKNLGGCCEWDNVYVVGTAGLYSDYRREDIRNTFIQRINHLRVFEKSDGGLSDSENSCCSDWCDIDMAPRIAQGDCIATTLYSAVMHMCADHLGIMDQVPPFNAWQKPRPGFREETVKLIRQKVDIKNGFELKRS